MKKYLLISILHCSFLIVNSYAQQYGWVDISNNLPSSNGTASLSDLHFINNDEGWICSSTLGEIYHTTDGGQTFETQTTQYSTNAIYMINSQLGYAGGYNGRVYKTTNGGTNWVVHGSIGGPLRDIDFPPNSDSGYCCGDNGKIYKITPSGVSSMFSGVSSNLKSISFPGSEGFVCGQSAILHFDGSWLKDQTYPGASYNGICMVNDTTGWAIGDAGAIIKTTDGLNWYYQTNPDTSHRSLYDVFFLNTNEGWAVGWPAVILHTTNSGTNWSIEIDGWTSNFLTSVQFTSSTNGYILGNNKTLFKYGLLTEVEQQSTAPTEFKLEQNYPNPFNPSTSIQYTIGSLQFVQLKVYDVLGHEIATLVNEEKAAGVYNEQFTMNNLSSGIYFYQLKVIDPKSGSGQVFVQTKKMILMK